ncbi:MAG: hypothetical protein QOI24_4555 [Acidobacteriota bacterium]|nr:hypothetical protein [Acidobacteriota bacterium]
MRKLAIRFALTVALLLFAAPMFAQEYGCYDCRQDNTSDATFMWCDHPQTIRGAGTNRASG